jgi:glucose/arabinose dehydrogenase/cytochrome c5
MPYTRLRTTLLMTAALWLSQAGEVVLGVPAGEGPVKSSKCPGDNGGLTLSPGFCATVFADHLGHARHLAVARNGVVYVNTWSGSYYSFDGDRIPKGGFLIALEDKDGHGRADRIERFGPGVAEGGAGGTGIGLYKEALYAEINDRIVRYPLRSDALVPKGEPQVVVSGLPLTGEHPMHPFVIDTQGNLFVDIGSQTNACQPEAQAPAGHGTKPCAELESRGGIWRYDANRIGQKFSPAERYAAGIRNGEGMDFDASGRLYVSQHGRDQLGENWPNLYTPEHGHELPAEEVVILEKDADYGWPECYFDGFQRKRVLAPEYGGNGGALVGECASKKEPVAFFPAHYAPDDLLIYKGTQFPVPYRGGAFIAFHGSWNRAPAPQGGYNIVYQPLVDGHVSGAYVVFADGFAGAFKEPGRATFRPTGLAAGPDGALYVSEDMQGRIWRITYAGAGTDQLAAAPAPAITAGNERAIDITKLPVPAGATADQVALGSRIFHGEVAGGTCSGCHGSDAAGSTVGPDLTRGKWLWSDGSLGGLRSTIERGVSAPKQSDATMPPKGGAPLSEEEVSAVAAFVWALGHRPARSRAEMTHPQGRN